MKLILEDLFFVLANLIFGALLVVFGYKCFPTSIYFIEYVITLGAFVFGIGLIIAALIQLYDTIKDIVRFI